MRARRLRLVGAGAVAVLGAVGFIGFLLASDSRRAAMPSLDVATNTISAKQLAQAARARLFFGHVSVGENILAGAHTLYEAEGVTEPSVLQFTVGMPLPEVQKRDGIVHTVIGENGDPLGKLENFDSALRSGMAGEVDVALLKFCYVDFNGTTDVQRLFEEYRTTLDALERDFPNVTFLHATAPLMVGPSGIAENIKAMIGRDDNVPRERYNLLMRQAYGPDRLFDIAAIEGTAPDGTRRPELYGGYTTDGGHLNETGSAVVAAGLLRLLAAAGQS